MKTHATLLILGIIFVTATSGDDEPGRVDEDFDYDFVGSPYFEDGKICQDKDEMIEMTKFDKQMLCKVHIEEKCEDMTQSCHNVYMKKCTTNYKPSMTKVNVRVCPDGEVRVLERNEKSFDSDASRHNSMLIDVRPTPRPSKKEMSAKCIKGKRIVCVKKYETECYTEYVKQDMEEDRPNCKVQMVEKCRENGKCDKMKAMRCRIEKRVVTKTKPVTRCHRVPRQFCRKEECRVGRRTKSRCYYRTQLVNEMVPEEQCNYIPKRICKEVAVSSLNRIPQSNKIETKCHKEPIQKCQMRRINPRQILKKMRKKVCKDLQSGSNAQQQQEQNNSAQESGWSP